MSNIRQILITVGTFQFDDLIQAIDKEEFYENIIKNGINKILIQKGNGTYIPKNYEKYKNKLNVEIASILTNFESYIIASELVISHGGAGSILETLKNKKKLIVCINQKLMDNHQIELVSTLEEQNYILHCKDINKISESVNILLSGKKNLTEYPEFNYDIIPNEIYKLIED